MQQLLWTKKYILENGFLEQNQGLIDVIVACFYYSIIYGEQWKEVSSKKIQWAVNYLKQNIF